MSGGRPAKPLDAYRDELTRWYFEENCTQIRIVQRLASEYNINISTRALRRSFNLWDVQKQKHLFSSEGLEARIRYYIYQIGVDDDDLLILLKAKGYDYNFRQIADFHRSMGILRRTKDVVKAAERYGRLVTLFTAELEGDSPINHFGRTLFHEWIRKQGIMIARLLIFSFLFCTRLTVLQRSCIYNLQSPQSYPRQTTSQGFATSKI
jgi:hypothetical protein